MPYGINLIIFNNLLNATVQLDLLIKQWLQIRQVPCLINLMSLITNMGSPLTFVLLSILVFIYLARRKQWLEAIASYTCLLSAWILMDTLKLVFARPRPLGEVFTVATGYSLPSGHAMISMAYYGFIAILLLVQYQSRWNRIAAVGLAALILCIGFSRIYLNVHYFSDVLAGYVLGLLVLFVNWWGLNRAHRKAILK